MGGGSRVSPLHVFDLNGYVPLVGVWFTGSWVLNRFNTISKSTYDVVSFHDVSFENYLVLYVKQNELKSWNRDSCLKQGSKMNFVLDMVSRPWQYNSTQTSLKWDSPVWSLPLVHVTRRPSSSGGLFCNMSLISPGYIQCTPS